MIGGALAGAVPNALHVEKKLDELYLMGRNPIFHAKSGSTFYTPHGTERQEMQARFETLTSLLVCLLQYKFGHQSVCRWGNMSQNLQDAQARISFSFDEVVLKHHDIAIALPASVEVLSSPRRFGQLWARTSVLCPKELEFLTAVDIQKSGAAWMQMLFAESIPLKLVNTISLELNLMQYHGRAPRPSHPQ